ncbi:hypothetical protein [Campylobacter troglodytis]|uniref:hypothetical protein n=1 Tax=Campylobacter troglodytis TaxID=654363 RepID=UPI00163C89DD|nr:hypothetical protein [Campylobacter troglodytis]
MINFNTNSFNPLANLKVSVRNTENKSINSNQNTNSNQNSNNILGYEVSKDWLFYKRI